MSVASSSVAFEPELLKLANENGGREGEICYMFPLSPAAVTDRSQENSLSRVGECMDLGAGFDGLSDTCAASHMRSACSASSAGTVDRGGEYLDHLNKVLLANVISNMCVLKRERGEGKRKRWLNSLCVDVCSSPARPFRWTMEGVVQLPPPPPSMGFFFGDLSTHSG